MNAPHGFAFGGIGTRWQLDAAEPIASDTRQAVLDAVEDFDRTWSRFRKDSLVTRMRSADRGGAFVFPAEDTALFDLYDTLHDATDGAVDPLVGADLEALGYDADYSLRPVDPPPPAPRPYRWWTDVHRDGPVLVIDGPVTLDVGAVGKGFLVDRLADLLRADGHETLIVDGSGDITVRGADSLRVGLEHPSDPERIVGIAELADAAICASATNRRRWGHGLHHVVDARTGRPTDDVVATWAIAPSAAVADGWATALFFVDRLIADASGIEWARVTAGGRLESSRNFPGELYA
ncbi:FAD:protein FMN transferase [Curtobacterium sp. MCSS17_008]|uniref:FAD:protein FMN transferase n=1 Tax=Curtobacterium sp. MCSS17_008 TaxID=2175647 RepID=UPI000DA72AA3|nr:FAD:protein FMN transferase [Curtobacterium sp. MCSS17_008]PZF56319.1 FAD:protein FMN transferase [Curtobacterium sp. MCSS17_008]